VVAIRVHEHSAVAVDVPTKKSAKYSSGIVSAPMVRLLRDVSPMGINHS
jgi:hypothetical protein